MAPDTFFFLLQLETFILKWQSLQDCRNIAPSPEFTFLAFICQQNFKSTVCCGKDLVPNSLCLCVLKTFPFSYHETLSEMLEKRGMRLFFFFFLLSLESSPEIKATSPTPQAGSVHREMDDENLAPFFFFF